MSSVELLGSLLKSSEPQVFAKSLARNDHSWADDRQKHQAGIYIPAAIRMGGFFPAPVQREDLPHIFDIELPAEWPQAPEHRKPVRLVHYSNKGAECHLTRLPKDLFMGLGPSSLFIALRKRERQQALPTFSFLVVDSLSGEYDEILDMLDLSPAFEAGVVTVEYEPEPEKILEEALRHAASSGTLAELIAKSALPSGSEMAKSAQDIYLARHRLASMNPYADLKSPGDSLIDLIDIEYADFRNRELRLRSAQLLEIFLRHNAAKGLTELVRAIVGGFSEIVELFKSMRGARASRAGTSFELHIRRMLDDSRTPYDYQHLVGKRSPDFILPSFRFYQSNSRQKADALILSAKTTLRERWQQILNEGSSSASVFLATLDQTITSSTLDDLAEANVNLVVPERYLRTAAGGRQAGVYSGRGGVVSFRAFFDDEVGHRRAVWNRS